MTVSSYLGAAGIGLMAGMRSMTPPALVSFYLTRTEPRHHGRLTDLLGKPQRFRLFALLAAGEIIADKFPQAPARTFMPALIGRLGTSALASGALYQAMGADGRGPAALSAAVTGVATFATHRLRMALNRRLPNLVSGVLEDAVLLSIGVVLLRRWQGAAVEQP